MIAGNWAVATFVLVSLGSWYAHAQVLFRIRRLIKKILFMKAYMSEEICRRT